MSLNKTVSADRVHIGFFGMRNAGKSSLVNAVTGQALSVVSEFAGTTTDPVKKAMELLPLGPVVILDTPGLDDEGELGELRVERAKRELTHTDIAVIVLDADRGMSEADKTLERELAERKIPYIVAYNKADKLNTLPHLPENSLYVSAKTGEGVEELKERLGALAKGRDTTKVPVSDMVKAGDVVVLVTPIDESAPKGRIILPQQLVLRDLLDAHAIPVFCQDGELCEVLASLSKKPRMVITDSQVFGKVAKDTPKDIPLTSFSILMARYKGELENLVQGVKALSSLSNGDRVLISEGCTHHRQCKDIGSIKMPGWIEGFSGAKPTYSFTSGGDFPENLKEFKVIVHCGGCMLSEAEMKHRTALALAAGVPMVNYGIAIAGIHGILPRSLELFPETLELLK